MSAGVEDIAKDKLSWVSFLRPQIGSSLSGGQQARFQVLLLEFSRSTMLLLDEPTVTST